MTSDSSSYMHKCFILYNSTSFYISDKISLTMANELQGVRLFDIEYKWLIFMVTLIRLMSMSLQ